MAYSKISYVGTGGVLNATFPFPYLAQTDIGVTVDGVSVAFTFLNTSAVTPTANPPAGSIVQVRRITQKASPPVDFTDGSVLLEKDLDLMATYCLYVAQEADDMVQAAMSQNSSNQLDARSLRIVNLAPGVNATDAVNKAQNDAVVGQVDASKVAAQTAAQTATTKANEAAASAAAAQTSGSAIALKNSLAASSGASLVTTIAAGTGTVARTVESKLRESLSVIDTGADASGGTSAVTAFQSAGTLVNSVLVPAGTFTLPTAPSLSNVLLNIGPNVVLTGAGAVAIGYTTGAKEQTLHVGTAGNDFATKYIRRNASHTGGTAGFVSSALKVDTYVGVGCTNYEWAITGRVDSAATGGQNVGVYGQGVKRGTGPLWGMVAEAIDATEVNNPTNGLVGIEVDCRANGTDSLNNRIGVDIVVNRQNGGGAANQVGYGIRIQNGGDAGSSVKAGVSINCSATVGFDTSAATISQAAFKLAANQNIAFDAAAINQFGNDTAGLTYSVSGVKKSRLNNVGGIELDSLQTVVSGGVASGSATATLSVNKPGANAGVITWLSVVRSGTQLWIPCFGH